MFLAKGGFRELNYGLRHSETQRRFSGNRPTGARRNTGETGRTRRRG